MPVTETIDMTPTDEGFANIAMMLLDQVIGDVKPSRKNDDRVILDSVLETVGYLARKDPALVTKIRAYVKGAAK